MTMTYDTTPTFHESFGEIPKGLLATLKKSKVTPAEFYALELAGFSGRRMNMFILDCTRDGAYRAPFPLPDCDTWLTLSGRDNWR